MNNSKDSSEEVEGKLCTLIKSSVRRVCKEKYRVFQRQRKQHETLRRTGHSPAPDVRNVQSSCGHTKVDERFHGWVEFNEKMFQSC